MSKTKTPAATRKPFEDTKVENNNEVAVVTTPEAEYVEIDLGNGTILRNYVGVQPGAQVSYAPAADVEGLRS